MMKMIRNLFALVLALTMLLGVAMAEQATATAHKASGVTIDGKLDEWNLNDPLVMDGGPAITLDAAYDLAVSNLELYYSGTLTPEEEYNLVWNTEYPY